MFPNAQIPRSEYPRPDRQRGLVEGADWLNLNGPWQFRFDPHRRGEEEQWFDASGPDWREQIIVPFCWESLAAWGAEEAAGNDNYFSTRVFINPLDVTIENHRGAPRYEVGWYRRRIQIPNTAMWRQKRVILTVGAADFATDCWCNGVHLGRNEGGYLPFEFDLTNTLETGPNGTRTAIVILRVEDPMDHREQPVGKQWNWYTTTSGIWQTVYVEPRAASHIESFRVTSDIDTGKAHFEVLCTDAPSESSVAIEIIPPEGSPHEIVLTITNGIASGDTEISPVILWDPGDPQLYRTVYRLMVDDQVVDVVRGYFGMRKISTAPSVAGPDSPAMLCLNNKPIYLRGALYQSYHPAGVYTATDAAILKEDIAFARRAGFDFLRIHIKLDDPLVLYYADTVGILLMQDFPNFGEGGDTPLGRRRFEEMMRLGMKRDFNHPSIIAWCLFNETWGFGGQTELMKIIAPFAKTGATASELKEKVSNLSSFKWVHAMWKEAKALDPTRLIEDMSVVVWEHLAAYGHVDTDINSWHFYINDYAQARKHIADVVSKTYKGSSFNYVEGYQQASAPLINSEYGGVGALDGDVDVSWSFRFLTNELRRHGQLSAYIYTELHDVEWEYNGLLNYDRTPKDFGYRPTLVNQGDVLPIDAAPISRLEPGSEATVDVSSSHFSRKRRENVTLQWMYSGMDTLGTLHPSLVRGAARIPFTHHRVELARRIELTTPATPMLCTLSVAAVTPDGTVVASNFIQHFVVDGGVPEREERGETLVLRRRVYDWDVSDWAGHSSSRAEARASGSVYGEGTGYFRWVFSDPRLRDLARAKRVRVLCEVSSRRSDTPQTDIHRFPSSFELSLGNLAIHRSPLPDHPHDTRGALSYLRGGKGAYGYLIRATVEDDLLQAVAKLVKKDASLTFDCRVPESCVCRGGLTVYDYDCGRYPIGPTLIIEW